MNFSVDLSELLGGGCGSLVYVGTLNYRSIAAKKYCLSDKSVRDEARFLECCSHTNVIKFYGLHAFKDEEYLVMELAEAGNLLENLGWHAFSTCSKTLLIRQLCDALEHIHARNIIHRDIHPRNLLLKSIGPPHIVIADFGSAEFFVEGKRDCAPHWIVDDDVYTFKSDIFLLAITAVQIFEDSKVSFSKSSLGLLTRLVANKRVYSEPTWRWAIFNSLNQHQEQRPSLAELRKAFEPQFPNFIRFPESP